MNIGSGLLETWIPDGGFEIQRRKVKAADGGAVVTDCLVPKWSGDDLTVDRPLHRQPCLHRVLADCRHDQIVRLAGLYGLLTVTVPRNPEPGKAVHASMLPPEPVEIWHRRSAPSAPPPRCGTPARTANWSPAVSPSDWPAPRST